MEPEQPSTPLSFKWREINEAMAGIEGQHLPEKVDMVLASALSSAEEDALLQTPPVDGPSGSGMSAGQTLVPRVAPIKINLLVPKRAASAVALIQCVQPTVTMRRFSLAQFAGLRLNMPPLSQYAASLPVDWDAETSEEEIRSGPIIREIQALPPGTVKVVKTPGQAMETAPREAEGPEPVPEEVPVSVLPRGVRRNQRLFNEPDWAARKVCFNCHGLDHHYAECPWPRGVFCFRCGFRRVTLADCVRCKVQWRAEGPYLPRLHGNVPWTEPLPQVKETSRERRLRRRRALERQLSAIPETRVPCPAAPKKKRRQRKKRSGLNWQEADWVTQAQGREEDEPMCQAQPVAERQFEYYPFEAQGVNPPVNLGSYGDEWAERQRAQYMWDQHRALQLEEEARSLRNRWAN